MKEQPRIIEIVETIVRHLFRAYFRLVYGVKIEGMENLPVDGGKLVIVANHGSLLDGPLLWAFLPLRMKALISREIAQLPLLRPFMLSEYVVQVETLDSHALRHVITLVNNGTPLLIFPEGRRSTTGALMKIYEGAGFITYKTGARVLPVYIKDTYRTLTSLSPVRKRLFTRLTIVIGTLQPRFELDHLPVRKRRERAAGCIYALLVELRFIAHNRSVTIAQEVIRRCTANGRKIAFKDITGAEISYRRVLAGAFLLGGYFKKYGDRTIGLLLPNLSVTVLLFLGLLLQKKVPAFLNYASGRASLTHMMALADLNIIVTSREFLGKIGIGEDLFAGKELLFIEDLLADVTAFDKLTAFIKSRFPSRFYRSAPGEHTATAVILFTSGSEGMPKGVALSHENIVTNIHQCLARIDVQPSDYLLSALPVFHSFGLTVGVLLPLFADARTFLYVSPLHYRVVPETAYREKCTILVGTNIFLNGYGRKANPYDFFSMRYVYCGAEALLEPVFQRFARKFGIRVLSGYGATECAPVIGMCNALEYEYGSVGKFLPGIAWKLLPVEGIVREGRQTGKLFVKGKNVMKGYLKNDAANHKYRVEDGGWYDTGDIVAVSDDGFLEIVGREKRFAKVSGEMVSLTALEEALTGVFGERKETAVMTVPDERRGERIVLVANSPAVTLPAAREALREKGFAAIVHPREIRYVKRLPKLATGKVDYVRLNAMMAPVAKEAVEV
jgi:acyl-[acyl-carrier-protein]-phospholipid O-acyltransferase/long-chain-fatty-acid--[acyl-carrier-protein] ligase